MREMFGTLTDVLLLCGHHISRTLLTQVNNTASDLLYLLQLVISLQPNYY